MIDARAKTVFATRAGSPGLERLASRYGMRSATSFARRFVAGEAIDDAIAAARAGEAQGLAQTLDLLGESVGSEAGAQAVAEGHLRDILAGARPVGGFVRIDMENSPYVEGTLAIFRAGVARRAD